MSKAGDESLTKASPVLVATTERKIVGTNVLGYLIVKTGFKSC